MFGLLITSLFFEIELAGELPVVLIRRRNIDHFLDCYYLRVCVSPIVDSLMQFTCIAKKKKSRCKCELETTGRYNGASTPVDMQPLFAKSPPTETIDGAAVVSFVYGRSACSERSRRLLAPVVRFAGGQRRLRGSDARWRTRGVFPLLGKSSRHSSPPKSPSKSH